MKKFEVEVFLFIVLFLALSKYVMLSIVSVLKQVCIVTWARLWDCCITVFTQVVRYYACIRYTVGVEAFIGGAIWFVSLLNKKFKTLPSTQDFRFQCYFQANCASGSSCGHQFSRNRCSHNTVRFPCGNSVAVSQPFTHCVLIKRVRKPSAGMMHSGEHHCFH